MTKTLPAMSAAETTARSVPRLPWRERRDWFRAQLDTHPLPHLSANEIEAHFAGMPAHYWGRLTESDLAWGLETIHGFLAAAAEPGASAALPYVKWQPHSEPGLMRLMLCTWDRPGLLAKTAAALSTVRLNIFQAEVFTRSDNVVLDVFTITDADGNDSIAEHRLQELTFLLEGALSEPPRFASVWACSRHKFLVPPSAFKPCIAFDNEDSPVSTLVHIVASDRLGLLYDVLQALADFGLDVTQARIETDEGLAHDIIHVRENRGGKVVEPRRLEELRRSLERALTVEPC